MAEAEQRRGPRPQREGRGRAAGGHRARQGGRGRGEAQAINEFLTQDLLTQAEPDNNAAEDHVTLLEVLDRAAEKVGQRFADQPELESALRETIARDLPRLGLLGEGRGPGAGHAGGSTEARPAIRRVLPCPERAGHILRHRGRRDAEVIKLAETAAEGLKRTRAPNTTTPWPRSATSP